MIRQIQILTSLLHAKLCKQHGPMVECNFFVTNYQDRDSDKQKWIPHVSCRELANALKRNEHDVYRFVEEWQPEVMVTDDSKIQLAIYEFVQDFLTYQKVGE